jgi:hypothetical protein
MTMCMKPIQFCCQTTLPLTPEEICERILDLANWPGFTGYGLIPGIRVANYAIRKPEIVGSRIQVTNLDGSSHVEEIVEWQPGRSLGLVMREFSPPLSRLATSFDELWEFQSIDNTTQVRRSFKLHAKGVFARMAIRLIAIFLKRAVARHLQQMQ